MMAQSSLMHGGIGQYSYTKNSTWQRDTSNAVMDAIKEAIIENLEIEKLSCGSSSSSSRFAIADLGCSIGPNTFYAMQTIIEAVQHKYDHQESEGQRSDNLEFQVLFNDQIGNDFNTLFTSLPNPRNYLVAAVPGSFYGRLFPSSSVHIAYSSSSINWLSKVPAALQVKESPAWNAGKIHYTGASDAVVKAYRDRFEEDLENFLKERAKEIRAGGMIMIKISGVPHRNVDHVACLLVTFFESILLDMVKEGVVEKERVDSFNMPTIYPCIEDMRSVVDKNKCVEIVKMEIVDVKLKGEAESMIMNFRASSGITIANHFGNEIVEQLFARAKRQKLQLSRILDSSEMWFGGVILAVLKRKLLY